MKLINNCELIAVNDKDKHYLLVNTLNGDVNVLIEQEGLYIEKWRKERSIKTLNKNEEIFLSKLENKNYIYSERQEEEIENKIMMSCRLMHKNFINKYVSNAVFVLTYNCNFACPYCYEAGNENNPNSIMTKDMVDTIFNIHNNHIENIAFYGGEPFLPSNKDIICYIINKAPNAIYSATSNGFHLKEYISVLAKVNISNIMVTLDGPEDLHNKTRILKNGGATYRKILKGIELALLNNIRIKIRMNISTENLKSCIALRSVLINKYNDYYKNNKLLFEMQPIFQQTMKDRSVLETSLYYASKSDDGDIEPLEMKDNVMVRSLSPVLKAFSSKPDKFKAKYCNCDAESIRRFYDANGDIYSCILALGDKKGIIGKYYPSYYLYEESMLHRNIETIPECKNCKFKFLCGGGCAYGPVQEGNNIMKPNCAKFRNELFVQLPYLFKKYCLDKNNRMRNEN